MRRLGLGAREVTNENFESEHRSDRNQQGPKGTAFCGAILKRRKSRTCQRCPRYSRVQEQGEGGFTQAPRDQLIEQEIARLADDSLLKEGERRTRGHMGACVCAYMDR